MRAGARLDRRDARRIDQAGAAHALGVLRGDEIVGDDGEIDAAAIRAGIRRSTSAVLPEPTGPPMPTRAAPTPGVCGLLITRRSCMALIAACSVAQAAARAPARRSASSPSTAPRRFAGRPRYSDGNRSGACRTCSACACHAPTESLSQSELGLETALDGERMHEIRRQGGRGAAERAPCGRITIGSQVKRRRRSPIAAQATKPPLITIHGLMPKEARGQRTRSAILPAAIEPTCSAMPTVIAGLMVYLAT